MPSDSISADNEYIFAISPFLKKSTSQWNFKLGLELLRNRAGGFHIYPNFNFGFAVVPSYINFFASLDGYLERNDPTKIIGINPYLSDFYYFGNLFRLPDTDHELIVTAGLKGSNGIGGRYLISASYSSINNMLFYLNCHNYFIPAVNVGTLFNIRGEISGKITNRLSFIGNANFYNYNFENKPWNKPAWDAKFGLNYNLRNKILAGAELTSMGKRTNFITGFYADESGGAGAYFYLKEVEMPTHFNLNFKAEYRYSKILSFWTKLNNVSLNDYYEWALYPTHRFMFMAGFTYSL